MLLPKIFYSCCDLRAEWAEKTYEKKEQDKGNNVQCTRYDYIACTFPSSLFLFLQTLTFFPSRNFTFPSMIELISTIVSESLRCCIFCVKNCREMYLFVSMFLSSVRPEIYMWTTSESMLAKSNRMLARTLWSPRRTSTYTRTPTHAANIYRYIKNGLRDANTKLRGEIPEKRLQILFIIILFFVFCSRCLRPHHMRRRRIDGRNNEYASELGGLRMHTQKVLSVCWPREP